MKLFLRVISIVGAAFIVSACGFLALPESWYEYEASKTDVRLIVDSLPDSGTYKYAVFVCLDSETTVDAFPERGIRAFPNGMKRVLESEDGTATDSLVTMGTTGGIVIALAWHAWAGSSEIYYMSAKRLDGSLSYALGPWIEWYHVRGSDELPSAVSQLPTHTMFPVETPLGAFTPGPGSMVYALDTNAGVWEISAAGGELTLLNSSPPLSGLSLAAYDESRNYLYVALTNHTWVMRFDLGSETYLSSFSPGEDAAINDLEYLPGSDQILLLRSGTSLLLDAGTGSIEASGTVEGTEAVPYGTAGGFVTIEENSATIRRYEVSGDSFSLAASGSFDDTNISDTPFVLNYAGTRAVARMQTNSSMREVDLASATLLTNPSTVATGVVSPAYLPGDAGFVVRAGYVPETRREGVLALSSYEQTSGVWRAFPYSTGSSSTLIVTSDQKYLVGYGGTNPYWEYPYGVISVWPISEFTGLEQ